MPGRHLFIFVAVLVVLLMGGAWWAADFQAMQMQRWLATGHLPPLSNPWKGTSTPDVWYYLTINTIFVSILLLIPAISAYVLRRQAGGPCWLMFWTAAWLFFALHLWFGVHDVLGSIELVFRDTQKPSRVANPGGDTVMSLWWTADVVIAWVIALAARPTPRWARIERWLLHNVIFGAALMASIVFSSNDYVRAGGIALLLAALASVIYRVVVYPFDPTTVGGHIYKWFFQAINLVWPWHRLPTWWAVFNLGALRVVLREKNLHDTSVIPVSNPAGLATLPPFQPRDLTQRNPDGLYNDLSKPAMGSSSDPGRGDANSMYFTRSNPGARFGRNIPLKEAFPEERPALMTPSPRLVSSELLARKTFIPATTLNYLAAAWIQFETHDWFNHGEPVPEDPLYVELADGDPWRQRACPMKIRRTRPDPTRDYAREKAENGGQLKYPPSYANAESHWWDASQIYGSDRQTTDRLRAQRRLENGKLVPTGQPMPDGKLYLDGDNLVIDPNALDDRLETTLTGFSGNWWAGLSLLHTLFAREHNAICDELKRHNPNWDGDRLFHGARMVNAALMAKIHTVEWTPAILSHPALQIGMKANWWGLQTERLYRAIGRISENEAFAGMPLSGVDHNGADYCLTEEFVSVYRLHPLMRDDLPVRSATDGRLVANSSQQRGRHRQHRRARRVQEGGLGLHRRLLLVRCRQPGRHHRAQLSQLPARADPAQRRGGRPRHHRHRARPRARRATLQPLPEVPAQEADQQLRRSGQPAASGPAAGAAQHLRPDRRAGQRRSPRPDGRPVLRGAAAGLRLQRHGLPHLHPHGLAAAQERPLHCQGLHRRRLHGGRHRLGEQQQPGDHAAAALPEARARTLQGR